MGSFREPTLPDGIQDVSVRLQLRLEADGASLNAQPKLPSSLQLHLNPRGM